LQAEAGDLTWRRSVEHGWTIDPLLQLPFTWPDLVRSLRQRIAERQVLDGTRVDRIYYDKNLKLTVVGQRWSDVEPLKQVIVGLQREQFEGLVRNVDGTAVMPMADEEAVLERVDLTQVRFAESPLRHLQTLISQDCRYDGIRVDRIYYDAMGQLQCIGLIDNPGQRELLQQLWADLSRDPRWAEQVVQQLGLDSMRPLPIAPMLQFIKEYLPVYETLDGATVVRVFHAPDGRLAFEGHAHSREQAIILGELIARILEESPTWSLRLSIPAEAAERIDTTGLIITPEKHNLLEAQRVLVLAWDLYFQKRYSEAIEQLELAMAYYPRYGATWYLRALCYIAIGRRDLARRDLRRVVAMESQGIIPKNLHYELLQKVQGPQRVTFEWLRTEAILQKPNGAVIRNPCTDVELRPEQRTARPSVVEDKWITNVPTTQNTSQGKVLSRCRPIVQ
jgi:tetratricopeptide (TPR) repeat protein